METRHTHTYTAQTNKTENHIKLYFAKNNVILQVMILSYKSYIDIYMETRHNTPNKQTNKKESYIESLLQK